MVLFRSGFLHPISLIWNVTFYQHLGKPLLLDALFIYYLPVRSVAQYYLITYNPSDQILIKQTCCILNYGKLILHSFFN